MTSVFVLSYEFADGTARRYSFHLGTDPRLAREIAEEHFKKRHFKVPLRTVALIRDNKLFDAFYGDKWHSAA
jgi:hypothetical protein